MKVDDIKPTRFRGTMELVRSFCGTRGTSLLLHCPYDRFTQIEVFLKDFFDQNPISQVGAIISHNKRADKVTELSGGCAQLGFFVLLLTPYASCGWQAIHSSRFST